MTFEQPVEPARPQPEGGVVAYHPLARTIGEEILAGGGNAADAFVAAAIAQNVLAEGVSSLAGPLGALVYWRSHRDTGAAPVVYLDADFNDPLDPEHRYSPRARRRGTAMLVPGAPLGLWELSLKYGSLPFSALVTPSIALAEEGFPVRRVMAGALAFQEKVLRSSEYGRRTFFRGKRLLAAGDRLRQPEVAAFLRHFADQGPDYVYRGSWGERFIALVQANRGRLTKNDLAHYSVLWRPAWSVAYRGHVVHAMSGSSIGGFWDLLALKVWEQANVPPGARPWYDPEVLALMMRIARHCWSEPYLLDADAFADEAFIRSRLSEEHAIAILERVRRGEPARPFGVGGTHSHPLIAHDRQGNIVSGTITSESEPWAQGFFVDGILLTDAGRIAWSTGPGRRRISVLTGQIVMHDEQPRFVLDTISNSLLEAAFQILVNLIDRALPLEQAVFAPRFGTFPMSPRWTRHPVDLRRNWLDPRVKAPVVAELERRGLRVKQRGLVDTGVGAVLSLTAETREAITVPIPWLPRPFE